MSALCQKRTHALQQKGPYSITSPAPDAGSEKIAEAPAIPGEGAAVTSPF